MFIATGYLTPRATAPQDPAEYLQQVLVPEAAVRLIRDDLRDRRTKKGRKRVQEGWSEEKELKNARSVMEESVDFGMCMHGDEEDEEDEDDEEKEEDEKYH
ncbi:hypothetical protein BC936DRAFT_145107 [Jimgerdemannia flammicorona]|uniref:Restriction of telomere capping protein 4 n=2 Tax=Jimgerdemannia flammicorona TaxID=994334 RepID=A0A433DLW7_9FUNG|nr:hypothetical protein BC936DRAFT_145107 [Jimgerdemannia flammicorona]RUS29747.1 hypothetical protein BC938DRAFT_480289 [Jimgerdemannia flammicorona]